MNRKPFIDTNIWIYAHLESDDIKKQSGINTVRFIARINHQYPSAK